MSLLHFFEGINRAIGIPVPLAKVLDPIRYVTHPVEQVKLIISPSTYGVTLPPLGGSHPAEMQAPQQQVGYPYAYLPEQYPQGYGGYPTWDYSTPSADYLTPYPGETRLSSIPPASWTSQDQWAALPPL